MINYLTIKENLKKNYTLVCSNFLLNNFKSKIRFIRGNIESDGGTAHANQPLCKSISYINEVFFDYKKYSKLQHFYGKVAEIGPGDNCGVALLFLADGCESVDLVDRFYSKRDPVQQAKIYQAIIDSYPELQTRLNNYDPYNEKSFNGIKWCHGSRASAEEFFNKKIHYDFIVSRAVLEHVYNPILAISRMISALNPGGMLLHKVDLRDHGMFSKSFHELKFLEVPGWIYKRMTRASGLPNRVLINKYRQIMAKEKMEHFFLVTRLAGIGDINPHLPYDKIPEDLREKSLAYIQKIRSKVSKSLSDSSNEDLCIAGFFLIATKMK